MSETRKSANLQAQGLREFAYLDEVSVQSLLASLIGALPAEVTSLTSRSTEAEVGGTIAAAAPLVAKAELTSRYKGASSAGSQVLSRAVAESLFKNLYELVADQLAWSPKNSSKQPIQLNRGELIEIEVQLAPDPIYAFNATMSLLSDLAEDYPPLLDNKTTAMILAESGPLNKVLERLLVGLIPIKAVASGIRAGEIDGTVIAGTQEFFDSEGVDSVPLSVVGVTEQDKYWRDVRRVLYTTGTFTVLGRVGRAGVRSSWNPVKLTEVMRDIAPQFPDAINRVGQVGYSAPVNVREERNRDAMERALVHFALATGGDMTADNEARIAEYAHSQRAHADALSLQGKAFDDLATWLLEAGILTALPENSRTLRAEARAASGLKSNSTATALSDFASKEASDAAVDEALIDLEIIAIYW